MVVRDRGASAPAATAVPGGRREHPWWWLRRRLLRPSAVGALLLLSLSSAVPAWAAGSRDVLWDIISSCLDPGVAGYCASCRWPRLESSCAVGRPCRETIEVWAQNEAFVALRDAKMCGCPEGFVHGLVVPRTRVTGVEDPRHPDGIWDFAWGTALTRIDQQPTAALAVNPPGRRSQDQLHLHILRLQKDARARFAQALTARVAKLDQVWSAASRIAAGAGVASYGILVTSAPEGGFIVLVDSGSPEKEYGVERCR